MTLSGRLPAPGEYERLPAGPTARTGEKRVGQDDCQDGRSERPDHSLHDPGDAAGAGKQAGQLRRAAVVSMLISYELPAAASTRNLSPLSAVSMIVFSARRLSIPITGIRTPTVSSKVTSVPSPRSARMYAPDITEITEPCSASSQRTCSSPSHS